MKNKLRLADVIIFTLLLISTLMIVMPFYNMLLISFSRYEDIITTPYLLFPKSLTFENYARLFMNNQVINSMLVSIFNVVAGTLMSLFITVLAAYSLSRKRVPFRKGMFYICIFTMYFSAGLIPWYLVLLRLGFANSIFVMTVPGMLSTFNMILMRNFFLGLPDSIEESAKIDGAGEFTIMWRIIVPLSAPIMATVGLFYAVAHWNEWWTAMLFIQDPRITPLSLFLRRIVIDANQQLLNPQAGAFRSLSSTVHSRSLNMAAVTIATVPILIVYPFLQKYFTKGIILGAIKA